MNGGEGSRGNVWPVRLGPPLDSALESGKLRQLFDMLSPRTASPAMQK